MDVTREDESWEFEGITPAARDGIGLRGGQLPAGKRLAHVGKGFG